jgi:hypothetical protein
MRPILTTLGFALLTIGSAQAAQEFRCVGPKYVTGRAIDAATIVTPWFNCDAAGFNPSGFPYRAWGNAAPSDRHAVAPSRPPLFTVQFKSPAAAMKVGEPVTLTGNFFVVLDPAQRSARLLVKDAEIVK